MKTLDEAVSRFLVPIPREPAALKEQTAEFRQFCEKNASLSKEIQENNLVRHIIYEIGRKLSAELSTVKDLPMKRRVERTNNVILTALMNAFVHGAMVGIEMEKQELPGPDSTPL